MTCPDCQATLKQIDPRPRKEQWACPVAMEEQRQGLLGKGKHEQAWIYRKGDVA